MASSARIEELRKKFEENPRRYFAPLANEYRKAGDIEQAIAICREYLPQQPGHMSGHIVYGQALYEAKQAEEAKTVFETALALDPENLIALRHLGDIALLVGDSEAARMWYGRVLEADPRNEEIQAQLASLDQSSAPTPVAPPAVTSAAPAAPNQSARTLEVPAIKPPFAQPVTATSPTVEISAMKPPVESLSTAPTVKIELDSIPTAPPAEAPAPPPVAPANDLGLEPTQRRFSVPMTTAKLELESPVSAPRETPPAGSFSLEGLETTSMAESAAPPAPPPAAPASPPAATVDLDFGTPAPESPAPSAAPTVELDFGTPAPAPEPPVSEAPLTVDLDFGTPAPSAPPASAAPVPPEPAAASSDDVPLLDIGELPSAPAAAPAPIAEAPAPAALAMDLPVPTLEPALAVEPAPAPVAEPEPALEWAPAAAPESEEESAAAPDSGPFVTETMAELYLQQGHRDEALRVYRALLEQRPGDASLQAKVDALSPQRSVVESEVHAGPTIRELLLAIASRRPGVASQVPHGNGAGPASASAMQDALGQLFGVSTIAPADEDAAIALGYAFMDLNGMEQGGAGNAAEPPLEAVLQPATQASPAPSNFSFDQFFSQRATSEQSVQSGIPAARPEESGDDVAQFNQWLQGLKQR